MARTENYFDIYYAVGNAYTSMQENEIRAIIKIRNSFEWKLIPTFIAVADTSKQLSDLYFFWKIQYE